MKRKIILILDSNSILHRAYHALPPLTTKQGEMVNAVYGFLLVFFKAIREFQPNYVCACFDFPAPTFRHKEFKEYKATRPSTPEDLVFQIAKIKEILKVFQVPIFEKEGFEADDVIGTICQKISKIKHLEAIILTGDLDLLQLVKENVKVSFLKKGVKERLLYDEELIKEKYQGLLPKQLIELKALKGDISDNIPGVKGIGEKTAFHLIKEFSSIENLYRVLEKKQQNSILTSRLKLLLEKGKEKAFLSKSLVSIKKSLPLEFSLEKCQWGKYKKEEAIKVLEELNFRSLIERLILEKEKPALQPKKNLSFW